MRTIVDIPEKDVHALDAVASQKGVSRAELVRRAVDSYLEERKEKVSDDGLHEYYGFLKDEPQAFNGLDGLAYQEHIRNEWDDRDRTYSKWGLHDHKQAPFKHKDDQS